MAEYSGLIQIRKDNKDRFFNEGSSLNAIAAILVYLKEQTF